MRIMCINIDSDTESWRLSQQEFERVGLTVERVPAVVEDNRPLAFNKSVYRAMERAKTWYVKEDPDYGDMTHTVYHDLLLFEDDVIFDTDKDYREWLPMTAHLPEGWMSVHLGCNLVGMDTTVWQQPTPYSGTMARLWNCYQSHATLYSAACVRFILDNMRTDIMDEEHNIFDDWFRRKVLQQGNSYVLRPMIAYQRPRKSEIWNCHADYTSVHHRGNQYLSQL